MKIAMVAFATYDGNSRIQQYANALVRRGDSVDVICAERGEPVRNDGGVHIYSVQSKNPEGGALLSYLWHVFMFLIRSTWTLARMHRRNRYDVIHVHSVPDFLVLAALIPKLSGARVILDIHDILPEFFASKFGTGKNTIILKMLILVERMSIALADYVIIANPIWEQRLLSRSVSSKKLMSMGNHPDPTIFFWRPRERHDGRFIITYPGSLNWHQGLEIAIRAFAIVTREAPEAEFHIYGQGAMRPDLERLAHELGIEKGVKFNDYVPTPEVARIMSESDLGVVAKRSKSVFGTEAASTKIMEFMSLGVPLVVSRTKIDSFYHTDERVKFYDDDSPEELAKAILLLRNNPALRQQLSENGLIYARENGWDKKKESYLAIVDKLAGCRPNKPASEAPEREPMAKQEI
jgi:glycosyltransferase involved in cell wall biosynthesis